MKKLLALLLCFAVCVALASCADAPANKDSSSGGAQTGTPSGKTDVATDTETDASTEEKPVKEVVNPFRNPREYDPELPHLVVVTDILNHELVVLDLNKAPSLDKINDPSAVVWVWEAEKSGTQHKIGDGLDDAKYRYSEFYKTDVVIACSSSGWAGIIEYPSGKLLLDLSVGGGPHSVELMPNGDFVVASSAEAGKGGGLRYYAISQGAKSAAFYSLEGCHGVCWNPDLERLITDGYTGVFAVEVKGYGKRSVKLVQDDRYSLKFASKIYCHDMMPVAGSEGTMYYVTADKTYIYTPSQRKWSNISFDCSFANKAYKGLASFTDGTVVTTPIGGEGTQRYDWSTCSIEVHLSSLSEGKVKRTLVRMAASVYFPEREFYKVHVFDKNYY